MTAKDPDTGHDVDEPQEVPPVYDRDEDANEEELPHEEFLGLTPGTANEERKPGDPPFPDQGY